MNRPPHKIWTTRALLDWTTDYFEKKKLDHPRLRAEMLLAHVLGTERIKLYMELDRPASELERAAFRDLVERAVNHEPVQYLVGKVVFYGLEIQVDPRVLIPRPSTECLVDQVLHDIKARPFPTELAIADICTGSGAIILALAKMLPDAGLSASDLSEDALTLAQINAELLEYSERIRFIQGDLFEAHTGLKYHIITSNPPYIRDSEWEEVEPNVKNHEPTMALRAGTDGLDVIRPLLHQAPAHLEPGGMIFVEIAASQKQECLDLVAEIPELTNPHVLPDDEGFDRILIAERV